MREFGAKLLQPVRRTRRAPTKEFLWSICNHLASRPYPYADCSAKIGQLAQEIQKHGKAKKVSGSFSEWLSLHNVKAKVVGDEKSLGEFSMKRDIKEDFNIKFHSKNSPDYYSFCLGEKNMAASGEDAGCK